jgi:predicted AlkP superfamily pyrophosphatase or phosphodiesterase
MLTLTQLILIGTAAAAVLPRDDGGERYGKDGAGYKHVAIFSFDGLHASDVDKYLALKGPKSNLSEILEHSHRFTGAYTSFPSDSFPGSMGPFTGSSPKTHGVWYDDIWDRSLYSPNSSCVGPPGAESM